MDQTYEKYDMMNAAGIGGCMSAAVSGEYLYVISNHQQYVPEDRTGGCLRVMTLRDPARPVCIALLEGLGNARQMVLKDRHLFIASRENGLFSVDITVPDRPFICCHYDPVEFATGLAMEGTLLYAACRQYGVEVIDAADPAHLRHLYTIRTNEAQSAAVKDGIVYAGVWGSQEIVVADTRLPGHPVINRIPVDGRGDGLCLSGNLLYAVTGHHRRTADGHGPHTLSDPCFANGWGLEIYDVGDPVHPVPLSRIHLPERAYYPNYDMWSVRVIGDYALMTFSWHGAFLADIRDPRHPKLLKQWTARIRKGEKGYYNAMDEDRRIGREVTLPFDTEKELVSPATGFDFSNGYLYMTTGFSDLYTVQIPELEDAALSAESTVDANPDNVLSAGIETSPSVPLSDFYRADGQIHAVVRDGSTVYAACGIDGIHELRLSPEGRLTFVRRIAAHGIVYDLALTASCLLSAEGDDGLYIYDRDSFSVLSHYVSSEHLPVTEVVLTPDGRFALMQAGFCRFILIDVTDPHAPKTALVDGDPNGGGIYYRQIVPGLLNSRYISAFQNALFVYWYDVSGEKPIKMPWKQMHPELGNGLCIFRDRALMIMKGGYLLYDPDRPDSFSPEALIRIPGLSLHGKVRAYGDLLFIGDRVWGDLTVLSLADPEKPVLLHHSIENGHPDKICPADDFILWPMGYAGLYVIPTKVFRR